jgi:hypothetical protein
MQGAGTPNMNIPSAEGTALLRELFHAILEIQSGIFTVLGIWLGARLSRRSELTRLRVERRTQIFDEACRVTAECSLMFGAPIVTISTIPPPHPLEISLTTLDRKIQANFSRAAYTAWHAIYDPQRTPAKRDFDEATRVALDALAKELK